MYVPLNLALSPPSTLCSYFTFVVPIIEQATIKISSQKRKQTVLVNLNQARN